MARPKGTGTLYRKENSPYWWLAFWSDDGTCVKESSGTKSRKRALALLRKRIRAQARLPAGFAQLGLVLEHELGGLRLSWLLTLALASFHSSNGEHFMDLLQRSVRIIRRCGNPPLSEVGAAIERFVAMRRAEGISKSTLEAEVSILRRGFRLAWRAGVIDEIPEMPKVA